MFNFLVPCRCPIKERRSRCNIVQDLKIHKLCSFLQWYTGEWLRSYPSLSDRTIKVKGKNFEKISVSNASRRRLAGVTAQSFQWRGSVYNQIILYVLSKRRGLHKRAELVLLKGFMQDMQNCTGCYLKCQKTRFAYICDKDELILRKFCARQAIYAIITQSSLLTGRYLYADWMYRRLSKSFIDIS